MAFRRTLAQRLFNITRSCSQTLTNCRISSPSSLNRMSQNKANIDPGESVVSRRFLHKRAVFSPEIVPVPIGGDLVEKLRELGVSKNRIRLDGVLPPAKAEESAVVTVDDARKLMKVAEIELVKLKLREIVENWIHYSEYFRVCRETCSDPEQAIRVANMLDQSGDVIVLGKFVCVKPEQVTKAMEGLIPESDFITNDPRKLEFERLKTQKSEIDQKAGSLVRRELWMGLGYLVVQTLGFMRLTFWELSWDVMEPICFYVTSAYFMAGYAFFLRTSKEPSFEGFYQSRLKSKRRRLIAVRNFDTDRYDELKKLFCSDLSGSARP